ncbi:MAG TPA: anti-sigma factor [Paraburkholderia sp.]|jgi:anti-sigma factor RsiW|nr:anti-sigma factor [Paraburkholderia sp.]
MNDRNPEIGDDDLHAYVDGMLSGERRREVEDRLQRDPELAARASDYAALNDMLHQRYDRILREPIPSRLARPASKRRGWFAANAPQFAGMAAALIVGIGIGTLMQTGRSTAESDTDARVVQTAGDEGGAGFARAAAIAHVVYMPAVLRPATMGAGREEESTRWIAGQLGTNTHAPVLTASGFELSGGRMLPGENGSIVEYMYRNASGERLTVCIESRITEAATSAFRLYADGPVKVYYWADGRFSYAVSGGLSPETLLHISHDVYAQLTGTS